MVGLNFLAIVVCVVIHFAIGFFWYSEKLFMKQWMKLSGIDKRTIEKNKDKMAGVWFGMFICSIIMSIAIGLFVDYFGAKTLFQGAVAGFLAWAGFSMSTALPNYLFSMKPAKLYMIDNFYYLISLVIMGAIQAVWI